jgi:hypothetical protein
MERSEIIADAKRVFQSRWPDVNPAAACLYLTMATIACAKQRGVRLLLQAGSMHWRAVPEELDDGISPTHFAYVWGSTRTMAHQFVARHRHLPEIHVWAVDPVRRELIDASTYGFPTACEQTAGMKWRGPKPPDFLWAKGDSLPDGASYEPNMEACLFAADMVDNLLRGA